MKKLLFLSLALYSFLTFGQNVVVIEYRHVESEDIAEFESKEMNYWTKVKQKGIDDGYMLASAFFRLIDAGRIDDKTMPTHAFVHVYKDFMQLVNSTKMWSNTEKILGMEQSLVSTNDISTTMRIQRYKLIDEILPLREFKYAVWNYAKPKDFNGFVNENLKLWKPYFQKKVGKNGLAGYGILARVHPQGMEQSSVLTYDHYTDLASAMQALSPMDYDQSIISKSKMSEYDPDGFRYRVLLELIQLQGSVE